MDVAYVARAGLFGMGSHRVHKIARFKKFSNCLEKKKKLILTIENWDKFNTFWWYFPYKFLCRYLSLNVYIEDLILVTFKLLKFQKNTLKKIIKEAYIA